MGEIKMIIRVLLLIVGFGGGFIGGYFRARNKNGHKDL